MIIIYIIATAQLGPNVTGLQKKHWQIDGCNTMSNSAGWAPTAACKGYYDTGFYQMAAVVCCYDQSTCNFCMPAGRGDGVCDNPDNPGRSTRMMLPVAWESCANQGGRLCTRAEIKNQNLGCRAGHGPCCGKGCNINDHLVWYATQTAGNAALP